MPRSVIVVVGLFESLLEILSSADWMPTRFAVYAICTLMDCPTCTTPGMLPRLRTWNAVESSAGDDGSRTIERPYDGIVSGTVPVLVIVSVCAGLAPAPPEAACTSWKTTSD